jgi:hypothetical protein
MWTESGLDSRPLHAGRAQWPRSIHHGRSLPVGCPESAGPDQMPPWHRMLIGTPACSLIFPPLDQCLEKDRGTMAPVESGTRNECPLGNRVTDAAADSSPDECWWRAIREEVDRPPVPAEELGGCCRECEGKAPRRRVTCALGKWPVPVLRLSAGAAKSNPFDRGITAPRREPPPVRRREGTGPAAAGGECARLAKSPAHPHHDAQQHEPRNLL